MKCGGEATFVLQKSLHVLYHVEGIRGSIRRFLANFSIKLRIVVVVQCPIGRAVKPLVWELSVSGLTMHTTNNNMTYRLDIAVHVRC